VLLKVKNLSKSFGPVEALRNVTFHCAGGEIHGLVGENGAGKSTLLRILAGVHPPDEGEIWLEGRQIEMFQPAIARSRGIAIIYQEFSLIPHLTVAENIYLGHEHLGRFGQVERKAMQEDAKRLLARVGLAIDPGRKIESLSVAEQQAVEIARALSLEARLLILDEPTAALGEQEAERLLAILRDVRSRGAGIIFVSHRLHEVLKIADVVTVLKDGQVVGTEKTTSLDQPRLISMMVGREISHTFPARRPSGGTPTILAVDRLSARSGAFTNISFELHKGEILGIAGLEGHGQRELLRALFGLEPVISGSIKIEGEELTRPSPRRCIDRGIAFVSDDRKGEGLILPFDIRENVCLATMGERQILSFVQEQAEKELTKRIVERLDVHPRRISQLVRLLSGGNQQKVVLGKWLAAMPKVLLLAEPTRGIDVGTKLEFYALLRRLEDEGLGIAICSRDMIELLGLSDRVLVVARGTLAAELVGEAATEEAIMEAIVKAGHPRIDAQLSA
jgi:ribose transport system ATP-binding protein